MTFADPAPLLSQMPTYETFTTSPSMPSTDLLLSPQKICGRLEFHCENGAGLSDTASNITGGSPEFDLVEWERLFKQTKLNRHKYFI